MTPVEDRRRVLAIVAHPDDEVLGCGGALALHARGDEVSIVILADGESSRAAGVGTRVSERESAAREAASILGAARVLLHGLPDNQLDTRPQLEIAKLIEGHIAELRPDTVYTIAGAVLNTEISDSSVLRIGIFA